MLQLIVMVVLGLVLAYFATQNTDQVSVRFLDYTLENVPLYFVAIISLLVGLFLSWVIALIHNVSSALTLRGKESTIKQAKKEATELAKQVHDLEIENARLQEKLGEEVSDDKSL